MQNEVLSDPIL